MTVLPGGPSGSGRPYTARCMAAPPIAVVVPVKDFTRAKVRLAEQLEQGFTTFCIKPSQFIDDVDELPGFLRDVMRRGEALTG